MSWGTDGIVFVGFSVKGVFRVAANGGKPELVAALKDDEVAYGPQMLPDRQHVLFTVASGSGTTDAAAERLNDLLLPIVKGYGSERSWVLLGTESLQTFGGSGFLSDYPIEQYVRDAKIDTLYEGTTAIQGQDLFFRIVKDEGGAQPIFPSNAQWISAEVATVSSRNAPCCSRASTMSAPSWQP
jgi:hypothetical protein